MPISIGGGSGNVWYDPATGILYYGSTAISYESVTYAQFIDSGFNLDDARHVIVADRHSTRDASDECKSLWWIEPSNPTGYKRVLRSPPIYCATSAALPSASTFKNGRAYQADLGPEGCDMLSDGTGWCPVQNSVIKRDTTKSSILICPASTFTGAYTITSHSSGARTQIQGAGVHGLTAAIAEGGPSVYISAGAGWTVGFHAIHDVDVATNTIVLDTAHNPSYGQPTIVLANSGTDVVLKTMTLPRLRANTKVTVDISNLVTISANNKNFKLKLGGTALVSANYSNITVSASNRATHVFYNKGSVSSQLGALGSSTPSGISTSSLSLPTAAIDTSTGTAEITFSFSPASPNEICAVEAYEVVVS